MRKLFREARENDDPELVIKAYSSQQAFTVCLNKHSAANSNHFLTRYCTMLNCPVLDRTQEYTEAFTNILYHPKLDDYLVRKKKVYRGAVLDDKKLIEDYKVGATILTTTFLSASKDPYVAFRFCLNGSTDGIAMLCTYNIKNIQRRSALDIELISLYPDEKEVLILRYVPFTITSIRKTEDGRRIDISLDECSEEILESNRSELNNGSSIETYDCRIEFASTSLNRTRNQQNTSCCCNEEIQLETVSGRIAERETIGNRTSSRRLPE
ncbi:unnamed protein product [Rotaria sp. Silwood2]|nr:unnamed protein product [Rotaria sp. Silwood2]CAF3235666.1 unnamed protein product [Rotaria sp. Silwood2]CAF4537839.1 unnamed protein product [Rotaria sp. Silwood2]CAF4629485.1 unnamed protein product [Rotaria sp. Silwood2]